MRKTLRYLLFILYAILVCQWLHIAQIVVDRTYQPSSFYLAGPAVAACGGGLLLMLDKRWVLFSPAQGKLRYNWPELVSGLILLLISLYNLWMFTIFATVLWPDFLLHFRVKYLDVLCGFAAGVLLAQAFRRE